MKLNFKLVKGCYTFKNTSKQNIDLIVSSLNLKALWIGNKGVFIFRVKII